MASIKRDIPVGNQGYVVHVTGNINGKKSFVLHGYARNKNGVKLKAAYTDFAERFEETKGYKKIKIPATGILLSEKDITKQQLKI